MNDYTKEDLERRNIEFYEACGWAIKIAVVAGILLLAAKGAMADVPDKLLDAIAIMESGNNPLVKNGDGGRAVGVYQIWEIYVDDVNRILKRQAYGYADRRDVVKSRQMVRVYLSYYGTERRLGHTPTLEDYARIHNGGPAGWKKSCTMKYWEKVKRELKNAN